jgi:hypothetical protein
VEVFITLAYFFTATITAVKVLNYSAQGASFDEKYRKKFESY